GEVKVMRKSPTRSSSPTRSWLSPPPRKLTSCPAAWPPSSLTPPTSAPSSQVVSQSNPAAVLYSSGTTGCVKAMVLSHRNFIALMAYYRKTHELPQSPPVILFTVPLFHVFGFTMLLRMTALGETSVLMERFDFAAMLQVVERYRVTFIPVLPSLIMVMVKSDLVLKHDLSTLEAVGCGGTPLGREVAERFTARFPHIEITQASHPTEIRCRRKKQQKKGSQSPLFSSLPGLTLLCFR
ncbi:hypothetical protein Taro_018266, partial [Colocasia esculenta]|nr:hypothetical protein [Colocasia esculenta]